MSVEVMANEGVRRAYTSPDNPLRALMRRSCRQPQDHARQHSAMV